MKKLKNEKELIKKAIVEGMKYGEERGVVEFEATDSAADAIAANGSHQSSYTYILVDMKILYIIKQTNTKMNIYIYYLIIIYL